jgi:hypothetical protein
MLQTPEDCSDDVRWLVRPEDAKVHPKDLWVPCDFQHAEYLALLESIEPELIAAFYRSHPWILSDGTTFPTHACVEKLWHGKDKLPLLWDNRLELALEGLLSEAQCPDPFEVMRKQLRHMAKATYVPGKVLFSWLYRSIETVFTDSKSYDLYFKALSFVSEHIVPNSLGSRVRRWQSGGKVYNWVVFCGSKQFEYDLRYNWDLTMREHLLASPQALHLPAFESVRHVAIGATLQEALLRDDLIEQDHVCLLDGEIIATACTVDDWIREEQVEIPGFPDRLKTLKVWVAKRDIFCAKRRRIVVFEGCTYGMPFHASVLCHPAKWLARGNVLQPIAEELNSAESIESANSTDLLARHEAVLALLGGHGDWVFHRLSESMTCNGHHVIKGTPARILRYFLTEQASRHRCEFDYRELLAQSDLTLGQKSPNLTTPLLRLSQRLAEIDASVQVQRVSKGKFRMDVKGSFKFSEDD